MIPPRLHKFLGKKKRRGRNVGRKAHKYFSYDPSPLGQVQIYQIAKQSTKKLAILTSRDRDDPTEDYNL